MSACWHTQPAAFTTWDLDRSGLGEVVRLTQDGRVRITEQTIIRIIERMSVQWTSETTPSFNNWVTVVPNSTLWHDV